MQTLMRVLFVAAVIGLVTGFLVGFGCGIYWACKADADEVELVLKPKGDADDVQAEV